ALLNRFCEVEDVPDRSLTSDGDLWFQAFFQKTHIRRSDGRYGVLAVRTASIEEPERWSKYVDEIEKYFAPKQIAPAVGSESSSLMRTSTDMHLASCVLPHNSVFKKEPQLLKQRIVFDASARPSNGRFLNDVLWTGPAPHPEDAQYQRMLWRTADGSISVFALSTLTFGTASAPFTAIRVIQQLTKDERCSFPKAEEVLMSEIYVTDILSEGHTLG
ncbi:uncharacterized protein LOC121529937, partial [Drosophila eugracilis]|uniref:uncharacterized protein LOC121529937 n=1 Tax=Drosophila eugracilis TaxID=29029 RepID=UPI001BDA2EC5